MPAIAGFLENNSCSLRASGSHQRTHANGITLVVLQHQYTDATTEELLEAYLRRGVAGLHERASDCALALFDEEQRQLVLSRDAIGKHPMYYRRDGTKFGFGSRVADLISGFSGLRLTRETLARRLVHGQAPPIGTTYFDDVLSIPPGCTLVERDGSLTLMRSAALAQQRHAFMTFDDAGAQFARLFQRAVNARLDTNSQTAVMVSGGLDSAAIICCATAQHAFGVTYGVPDGSGADEQQYIHELQAAGHRIERVEFYPIADVASIERNVCALETPFADDPPATLERAATAARQHGASVIMLGTWGDQVLAPFPPPHLQHVMPWHLRKLRSEASAFHRYVSDVPQRAVLVAFMRASLRKHLPVGWIRRLRARRRRRSLFDVLANEFPDPGTTALPGSYTDAVRTAVSDAEHVAALEATIKWGLANGLEVRLPYLDVELLTWLCGLSDEIAYHNSSLKPLLRAGLRDRIPAKILNRRDKGDYTEAISSGMLAPSDVLDSLDGLRRLIDFGLVSGNSARAALAKMARPANIAEGRELASNLLAIDVWLRKFFEAR